MSMREKIIGIALMWFLFLSCVSASHEDISFETDMGKNLYSLLGGKRSKV